MPEPVLPSLEAAVLKRWQQDQTFQQSLNQPSPRGRFVFFEGPPYANGKPGVHHMLTRAYKDAVARYKTMRGYHVLRRAGWDTHGLPVEMFVEKHLGLKSKRDIETYGVERFIAACRENVFTMKGVWEDFSRRMGYWLDFENAYVTMTPEYIESCWWIFSEIAKRGLLYQDFKVVPLCTRCGTALSSHELAQGYKRVKDRSVYIKFELLGEGGAGHSRSVTSDESGSHPPSVGATDGATTGDRPRHLSRSSDDRQPSPAGSKTYILAWTTTPWTLPGNVALAVDPEIEYIKITNAHTNETLIVAKALAEKVLPEVDHAHAEVIKGEQLVGKTYRPLFDFVDLRLPAGKEAYKIVAGDFVTTEDGTGVVHTAVMYGEDDFKLGQKLDLPKVHTVNQDGTFNELVKPWQGKYVKDKATEDAIVTYLKERGNLLKEEVIEHDYPFCWRCDTPLLYYAKDSWFLKTTAVKDQLLAANETINWVPEYLKQGRFGEWLQNVQDWAISRERYWGVPLPIWRCDKKHYQVIGSFAELTSQLSPRNRYLFVRHGESENNIGHRINTDPERLDAFSLTDQGRIQAQETAAALREVGITRILSSPFRRTRETAEIIAKELGLTVTIDDRLREFHAGPDFEGKTSEEIQAFHGSVVERTAGTHTTPPGGEDAAKLRQRLASLLAELDQSSTDEVYVLVSHGDPILLARWMTQLSGLSSFKRDWEIAYPKKASVTEVKYSSALAGSNGSFDVHRPYIDAVKFKCQECGGEMTRVPEVADVWFDSGAMPFAQWHYPFEHQTKIDQGEQYPADFISEGVDQTRGWFYSLLAVATLLGRSAPYKNVVSLGLINDAQGKKMSKRLGNLILPEDLFPKYGSDAVRFYLYTVSQAGDFKNFDPQGVEAVVRKTFLILLNVLSFSELHPAVPLPALPPAVALLDRWLVAALADASARATAAYETFDLTTAGRTLAAFVNDLSTWYVRRSRDRFREPGQQRDVASAHLFWALRETAKLLAPLTPLIADHVYRQAGGAKTSVHLETWTPAGPADTVVLQQVERVRAAVEAGHAERKRAGVKVRQPLSQVVVAGGDWTDAALRLLADELNVKEAHAVAGADRLPTGQEWLTQDVGRAGVQAVALDTTLTDELKIEGLQREFVRHVNALRKEQRLRPTDRVIVRVATDHALLKPILERHREALQRELKADRIELVSHVEGVALTLDGGGARVALERIGDGVA